MKLSVYVCIILILLSICLIIYNTWLISRVENFEPVNNTISKKIWLYWNSNTLDDAPHIIKFCIEIINKLCPNYEINLLTTSNYKKYVADTRIINIMDNPQIAINHKSDLIRLYLIYTYGGIYLDASIILLQSLDWIYYIDNSKYDIIMYRNMQHTTTPDKPVYESWFIASKPQTQFIKLVMDKFIEILNQYDLNIELQKLKNDKSVNYQNFGAHGVYHIVYYIFIYILYKYDIKNIYSLDCNNNSLICADTANNIEIIKGALNQPINDDEYNKLLDNKLIKITNTGRNMLKNLDIKPNSFMDKFIYNVLGRKCTKFDGC